MANQIKAPINYPVIAGGKIVAGGSVLFGQPNVKPDEDNPSTLKAVYLDAALTQPAQNPQGLSSDGVFDQSDTGILFGSDNTVYSIVIKGANKKELSYIPEYDLSDANAAATAQDAAAAAASSESNALSFENLTEALYTDFTNRYFGPFSSDPSVDDLGNPPNEGSIYFNTVSDVFFTWNGSAWINYFPSNPNGLMVTATGTTTPRSLADWTSKEALTYSAIADAKSDTKLDIGQSVKTNGYNSVNDGGGADYVVVAGGTGTDNGGSYHDMANGNQLELISKASLDAAVFGLQYDNSADNTQMASFISYCESNNIEAVISGNLTDLLNISITENLNLKINADLTHRDSENQILISSTEDIRGEASLTVDAAAGDSIINASTAGFSNLSAGDIAIIHSTEIFDPRTNTYYGDANIVKSFDATSITLDSGVNFDFATADNSKITIYKPHRINIYGKYTINGDGSSGQTAIELSYCLDSSIKGGQAKDNNLVGFRFSNSLSSHITRCHSYRCQKPTLGYGFSIKGASKNCSVKDSASTACRHVFTTNNDVSPIRGNITQDVLIDNCYGYGTVSTGDGFDTHAASLNIDFRNCTMYDSSGIGFNHESAGGSIINCKTYRSSAEGFRVRNETGYSSGVFQLKGNRSFDSGSTGIKVGDAISSTTLFSDFIADDNRTYDATGSGIWFAQDLAESVLVGTNSAIGFTGSREVFYDCDNIVISSMSTGYRQSAIISSGTITARASAITITPESGVGTADDLSTISGGLEGQVIILKSSSNSNTITVKDIVGNLNINGDFILNSGADRISLIFDGSDWVELSRSDNS